MLLDRTDRIEMLLDLIACDHDIAYWCYDSKKQLLESTSPHERIFTMVFQHTGYLDLANSYAQSDAPIIVQGMMDVTWIIVRQFSEEHVLQFFHVLGPFFNSLTSPDLSTGLPDFIEERIDSPRWKARFNAAMSDLPALPSLVYSRYALMLHYCVTGERLHDSDLLYPTRQELALLPETLEGQPPREHLLSHRQLNVLLKMLEDGDMNYRLFLYNEDNVLPVRSYADNPLQDARIACVIFTALCTRTAMKGGLTYAVCISLEDAYIRSLLLCNTMEAITDTKNQMYEDLIHRVYKARHDQGYSALVQCSCDYIQMHLSEPLNIGVLAARLNYAK
ncbi:MAG: hypothetical protein Q4C10_00020 [Clostridia bacterium]|nr:hypothetical protein [Clostridia bacterium]